MRKRLNRIVVITGIIALVALAIGVAGTLPALSQIGQDAPNDEAGVGGMIVQDMNTVSESISYQGRLTDNNGAPLHGSYTMRFFLYDAPSGGAALFDSGAQTVNVSDGLFAVFLPVPQDRFNGQALWLGIDVEGQTLSPRQMLRPAPYAMSLRPGAIIARDTSGDGLVVQNSATGTAVHVESTHIGLYTQGGHFAVYGQNNSSAQGSGYGGYFESSTGTGVYGKSTGVPSTTNRLPAGVYGYSENGAGVYGEAGSQFAWSGYFDGHVRIDGSLVISDSLFANDKSGYLFDVALNDDDTALNQGDVVVVTGIVTETITENIPLFTVRRAAVAQSTGVVGIVDRRYTQDENGRGRMENIPASPGDYVAVVTMGAFQAIKVDAAYGSIHPGDLLVSSPTPGYAMRADHPAIGTVIGKALSPLESGQGTVAVMVTLQ